MPADSLWLDAAAGRSLGLNRSAKLIPFGSVREIQPLRAGVVEIGQANAVDNNYLAVMFSFPADA